MQPQPQRPASESPSRHENWQDGLPQASAFSSLRERYTMDDLLTIMAFLRSDRGCPWDRAQSHQSLRANLLEEAYEAIDAIESGSPERLCDELGDVLMQVIFHAQMAREAGTFDITDVVTAICRKLISRHTHLFGDDHAETADAVLDNWERNKRNEKGLRTASEVLEDVPRSLPALQRAWKVSGRAAKVGFDWPDADGPTAKVREELAEVEEARGFAEPERQQRLEAEIGDLLFAVVNLARHLRVQPEMALQNATDAFLRRFTAVERAATDAGRGLEQMDLTEMDALWEQVKQEERKGSADAAR